MSQVLQNTSPTGTRATKVIGVCAILVMAWVVVSGLILTPQDVVQGESVRIMYVHVLLRGSPISRSSLLRWHLQVGCSAKNIRWVSIDSRVRRQRSVSCSWQSR